MKRTRKLKKDMMEEKQKLDTGYKNNEVVQNLIQQNTNMEEQIAELEESEEIIYDLWA